MKTKQEQIEEIQEIIGDSYECDSIIAELGSGDGDINIEEAAKAIVEAGYGDVTEYKAEIERYRVQDKIINGNFDIIEVLNNTIKERDAEIERLKAKNNELKKKNWSLEEELKKKEFEITYARNNGYEKGYDECEEYMKDKIKQAQIDILNELKTKTHNYYPSIDSYCISQHVVLVKDIDELFVEVEND